MLIFDSILQDEHSHLWVCWPHCFPIDCSLDNCTLDWLCFPLFVRVWSDSLIYKAHHLPSIFLSLIQDAYFWLWVLIVHLRSRGRLDQAFWTFEEQGDRSLWEPIIPWEKEEISYELLELIFTFSCCFLISSNYWIYLDFRHPSLRSFLLVLWQ